MGRHVAGDAPEMDALVEEAIRGIGAEIDAMRVPGLRGVVLGGGYGRGEGGVRECRIGNEQCGTAGTPAVGRRLSNDLDFFAITEEGATDADAAAIARALEPLSRRWTEKLGIDVDFTGRTPWRLRHDQERLMVQELVHGYFDVAGEKGEALFAGVERREPSAFPWMEAARLMMNRGIGLLLAAEATGGAEQSAHRSADWAFAARNMNKCILGAGDARLIARGRYAWRLEDRAGALADPLYRKAANWKFRPTEEAVCTWEEARLVWLDALGEISAAPGARHARSLYSAARWMARRRTLGNPLTFGLDPVERVLSRVRGCIASRRPITPSLRRDWEIFN